MTEDQHIDRAAAALDDPGVTREATAPRAVDPLREALEAVQQAATDLQKDMDRLAEIKATIRVNALRGGATTDEADAMVRGERSFVDFLARLCDARAALAAAPQPAPEIVGVDMASGPDFSVEYVVMRPAPMDREALVEMVRDAVDPYVDVQFDARDCASDTADALLAAGLRLPGVVCHETPVGETQAPLSITDDTQAPDETLAWAVVDEDGAIIPYLTDFDKERAQRWASIEKGNLVRVAIRIVEDEA